MILQNSQVSYEELPHLSDVEYIVHPKSYLKLRLLKRAIFFLILLIAIAIVFLAGEIFAAVLSAAVWLVVLLLVLITEIKGFKVRGYALREKDITYKQGLIFYNLTTLPFNRIQHSEISQGPLERAFKLTSLKIFTAGGASSDLEIGGLDNTEAEKLKEFIAKVSASND